MPKQEYDGVEAKNRARACCQDPPPCQMWPKNSNALLIVSVPLVSRAASPPLGHFSTLLFSQLPGARLGTLEASRSFFSRSLTVISQEGTAGSSGFGVQERDGGQVSSGEFRKVRMPEHWAWHSVRTLRLAGFGVNPLCRFIPVSLQYTLLLAEI